MKRKGVVLVCIILFLTSCSHNLAPSDADGGDSGSASSFGRALICSVHTRVVIGKRFGVSIEEPLDDTGNNQPAPPKDAASVTSHRAQKDIDTISLSSQDDITFDSETFTLLPGQKKQIVAVLKSSQTGLASFSASGIRTDSCHETIDAGFLGHLKMQPTRLAYNTPQTMTVDMVDNSGSPLPLNIPLSLYLQSSDGFLSNRSVANGRDRSAPLWHGEAVATI